MISLNEDWLHRTEKICSLCGGTCCNDACPPISQTCYERLVNSGVSPDCFEQNGYRRLKTKDNGTCTLLENGRCTIHSIKPETCRAGPFTFDVKDNTIKIFLKYPTHCPVVGYLRSASDAYWQHFERAVSDITQLMQNFSREELDHICRIEEPKTERVAEIPRWTDPYHDHRN